MLGLKCLILLYFIAKGNATDESEVLDVSDQELLAKKSSHFKFWEKDGDEFGPDTLSRSLSDNDNDFEQPYRFQPRFTGPQKIDDDTDESHNYVIHMNINVKRHEGDESNHEIGHVRNNEKSSNGNSYGSLNECALNKILVQKLSNIAANLLKNKYQNDLTNQAPQPGWFPNTPGLIGKTSSPFDDDYDDASGLYGKSSKPNSNNNDDNSKYDDNNNQNNLARSLLDLSNNEKNSLIISLLDNLSNNHKNNNNNPLARSLQSYPKTNVENTQSNPLLRSVLNGPNSNNNNINKNQQNNLVRSLLNNLNNNNKNNYNNKQSNLARSLLAGKNYGSNQQNNLARNLVSNLNHPNNLRLNQLARNYLVELQKDKFSTDNQQNGLARSISSNSNNNQKNYFLKSDSNVISSNNINMARNLPKTNNDGYQVLARSLLLNNPNSNNKYYLVEVKNEALPRENMWLKNANVMNNYNNQQAYPTRSLIDDKSEKHNHEQTNALLRNVVDLLKDDLNQDIEKSLEKDLVRSLTESQNDKTKNQDRSETNGLLRNLVSLLKEDLNKDVEKSQQNELARSFEDKSKKEQYTANSDNTLDGAWGDSIAEGDDDDFDNLGRSLIDDFGGKINMNNKNNNNNNKNNNNENNNNNNNGEENALTRGLPNKNKDDLLKITISREPDSDANNDDESYRRSLKADDGFNEHESLVEKAVGKSEGNIPDLEQGLNLDNNPVESDFPWGKTASSPSVNIQQEYVLNFLRSLTNQNNNNINNNNNQNILSLLRNFQNNNNMNMQSYPHFAPLLPQRNLGMNTVPLASNNVNNIDWISLAKNLNKNRFNNYGNNNNFIDQQLMAQKIAGPTPFNVDNFLPPNVKINDYGRHILEALITSGSLPNTIKHIGSRKDVTLHLTKQGGISKIKISETLNLGHHGDDVAKQGGQHHSDLRPSQENRANNEDKNRDHTHNIHIGSEDGKPHFDYPEEEPDDEDDIESPQLWKKQLVEENAIKNEQELDERLMSENLQQLSSKSFLPLGLYKAD